MRAVMLGVSAVLGLLALAGCSREAEPSPAIPVVEALYKARIEGKMTGAPSDAELAKMTPYISAELQALLTAAAKLRDEETRLHPDEKPPFVEGDFFTSLFEGPTAARVTNAEERDGGWRLRVEFTDDRAEPDVVWSDYAIVRRVGEKWVVTDIEYAGLWDFANKGTLVESLKSGLKE